MGKYLGKILYTVRSFSWCKIERDIFSWKCSNLLFQSQQLKRNLVSLYWDVKKNVEMWPEVQRHRALPPG